MARLGGLLGPLGGILAHLGAVLAYLGGVLGRLGGLLGLYKPWDALGPTPGAGSQRPLQDYQDLLGLYILYKSSIFALGSGRLGRIMSRKGI